MTTPNNENVAHDAVTDALNHARALLASDAPVPMLDLRLALSSLVTALDWQIEAGRRALQALSEVAELTKEGRTVQEACEIVKERLKSVQASS